MVKKTTIGKIQLVLGIVILIFGLLLIFYLIPKITGASLFSTLSSINIATPESMPGYNNFSDEAKAILKFEYWNLSTNVSNLFNYTKLFAILLFIVTIISSVILILEGLANISNT